MASIISEKNGKRRIEFVDSNGLRKRIRLGKASMKQASAIKVKVEDLISSRKGSGLISDETAQWLAVLSVEFHEKLASVGLVKCRSHTSATMKDLIAEFYKHLNVKAIARRNYEPTTNMMLAYFGENTPIRDIEPLQAQQWRAQMKADGSAEATLSKRVKLARQIFRQGARWKMLSDNPFADVKAGSQINKSRQRFINLEDAAKVLEACPDSQWRLIFALSRLDRQYRARRRKSLFAGDRCPCHQGRSGGGKCAGKRGAKSGAVQSGMGWKRAESGYPKNAESPGFTE